MIHCLSGTVLSKTPDEIVIDCAGVGFKASIPTSVYAQTGNVGEPASIFTYMNVKDDGVELFGFADEGQLGCFKMLITVAGVGPRSALTVLSLYNPAQVAAAVASDDFKLFTACSGIGPKLAQRIVLELKDKVKNIDAAALAGVAVVDAASPSNLRESVAALTALGFSNSEAAAALAGLPEDLSTEDMVAAALRKLAERGR